MGRWTKPILCLLVLLASPFAGLAGRAEAGFVLRQAPAPAEVAQPPVWTEAPPRLDSLGRIDLPAGPPAGGTAEAPRDLPGGEHPHNAPLPQAYYPAHPDLQHSGTMSPEPTSSGPGAPGGLFLVASSPGQPGGAEASEQLFLAEDRNKPPSFPSRLFRPPRSCG